LFCTASTLSCTASTFEDNAICCDVAPVTVGVTTGCGGDTDEGEGSLFARSVVCDGKGSAVVCRSTSSAI
jgi:hypothetical protein